MKLFRGIAAALLLMVIGASAGPAPITVPTITALQTGNFSSYAQVIVQGYNAVADGGGGSFIWYPASTTAEDHCTIFKTGGLATGRFIRLFNSANLNVEMCGAYNDGTNAATTRQAFQYANDYVAASTRPNQIIEFKGAEYQWGANGGVIKAASAFCPRWVGGGIGSTALRLQPSTETAAFTFIGGSGSICKGSVSGVRIVGNGNAIGIELRGQDGMSWDFNFFAGKMAVLFCNCYTSAFTEENVGSVLIESMTNVTNLAEYRINNSGATSFRGSGFAPGTKVSKSVAAANPIINITGSNAQVYNAPLSISFTNSFGGATSIVRNASTNIASYVSGSMDLETTPSDVISLADTTQNIVVYGGSIYTLGANISGGVTVNKFNLARTYNIASGVNEYHDASNLRTQVSFTGNAGITLNSSPITQNYSSYQVLVTGKDGDGSYTWSGTVLTNTETSAGGACANPTIVGGMLYMDTGGYGQPTVTCTGNVPRLTNASWPAANFVITYSIHAQ